MLTGYHLQFLHHMDRHQVRYLVIGGQARNCHRGTPTSDLDVWVDISEEALPALELCLEDWSKKYPTHWHQQLIRPLKIQESQQFRFPDMDGCYYLNQDKDLVGVGTSDCIDVLTSIKGQEFCDVYSHCERFQIDGISIPIPSLNDLATISPHKADHSS